MQISLLHSLTELPINTQTYLQVRRTVLLCRITRLLLLYCTLLIGIYKKSFVLGLHTLFLGADGKGVENNLVIKYDSSGHIPS